jgi:hypothetical protein
MNVSVTLRLIDQFTQNVRTVQAQLRDLTRGVADFNRAAGGSGSSSPFARMQAQVRGLSGEVRGLVGQFAQLGRAMGTPTGGSFAQRQITDMRTLIQLQQQAISNNARMLSGPGGPGGPSGPRGGFRGGSGFQGGPGGFWGRRGFNPNASLADRAQYRMVNQAEQSLFEGFFDLDRARTRLMMLANPNINRGTSFPEDPTTMLVPGMITPETVAQAEVLAGRYQRVFRSLNRAQILDTFGEIVTNFENVQDAFTLLPDLLNVQDWHVIMGDTVPQARQGMLNLLRAIGLSGRLINNQGRLSIVDPNDPNSQIQATEFLQAYLRARIVGGRDVTPDQVFQVMKYLKAAGQSLDIRTLRPITATCGVA